MKTRLMVLVLLLTLALVAVAQAQAPEPRVSAQSGSGPMQPDAVPIGDEAKPLAWRQPAINDLDSTASPAINLGQPGLSFRYVRTLGETERPYLDDTNHFYDVSGVGVDGANVWITDSWGDRALKFDGDGNFLQQVGKAGVSDATGVSLDFVSDVAVDQNGNIWVVDAGADHIAKYDAAGKHVGELGKAWEGGSGNDRFNDPLSIAFDSAGNIYVSDAEVWGDSGNQRIQIFDSAGVYRATIGATGVTGSDNGHFRSPRRIAIYADRLYVADAGNHRVQVFDVSNPSSPVYVATLGVSGVSGSDNSHFDYPEGVGVDASFIYVADSNNQRVQIFARNTRAYVATLGAGAWGTDNSHFDHPSDVAVDSAGRIYVADNYNKRVQQFDSSRAYRRTYGTTGVSYVTDGYHYYSPTGVAVTADGSIYIAEERGHRLVKLNANGDPQWTVGEPGQVGNDNAHFFGPNGVATDSAGRAYVVESWSNHRVQIFNGDGAYYATLGTGYGTGNYEFNSPRGVAVSSAGIFVADGNNHRVQVYNTNRQYLGTIGVTGETGNDNAHFNYPHDVAVDAAGNVYVVDQNNHRVQKCSGAGAAWTCTTFAGVTSISGDDFGHLRYPTAVAVDAQGRVYVTSGWGERVQVFDASGAYLTTVGGNWSNRASQMRNTDGLAVDAAGNLYTAEPSNNQRIQKFAPGVPGWRQVNINGFGDRRNSIIATLTPYDGCLYGGVYNYGGTGAQLWRWRENEGWAAMTMNGFGDANNAAVNHLAEFRGNLYASTWNQNMSTGQSFGGQLWRSPNGQNWDRVAINGFGDPTNGEIYRLAVFSDTLYAATWSYTTTHGTEIWRSSTGDTGSWTRVVSNGFGDVNNRTALSSAVFDGRLYVSTYNLVQTTNPMTTTGGEVWRTADGASWAQVNLNGFGDPKNHAISALAMFGDHLYAGTMRWDTSVGGEIWRCRTCDGSDWVRVVSNGFGTVNTGYYHALVVAGDHLYSVIGNRITGLEIWRTANGMDWEWVLTGGFGDSNNRGPFWGGSVTTLNNRLYIGTYNSANGAEIWVKTLTADFTATPTRGAPPLIVQFSNSSAGDFTTSQWDFGDGGTSTAISPTHTYTAAGMYTVTLTIGDGADTSTITKPAYIDVHQRVFLPLVLRNYDPLLYDDFNDPTWDGAWNPAKWQFEGNSAFQVKQQGGALVFSGGNSLPASKGAGLQLRQPGARSLKQMQVFEGKLKISNDHVGGYASVEIFIIADNIAGHNWWTQCMLGTSGGPQASFYCDVTTDPSGVYTVEYRTSAAARLDTWHTYRIETDPITAELRFYLDGRLIGNHVPKDAAALIVANTFRPKVTIWNGDANTFATRHVDAVRITPAW